MRVAIAGLTIGGIAWLATLKAVGVFIAALIGVFAAIYAAVLLHNGPTVDSDDDCMIRDV
jgi:hypothetical protein